MKKTLCALPLLFLLGSCQKEIPTKMTGYFYTTDTSSAENAFHLYVDGVDKGILPQINKAFTDIRPEDSILDLHGLKVEFMSGKHQFQSRRTDGKLMASAEHTYHFYKNKTEASLTGNLGASGSTTRKESNEVYVWLAQSL